MHGQLAGIRDLRQTSVPGVRLACVLAAALALLVACNSASNDDASAALPAVATTRPTALPPMQPVPRGDAPGADAPHPDAPPADAPPASPAPRPPAIDASTPPRLTGIALADATAAAAPMGAARPATSAATPVPVGRGKLDDRCAGNADCAIKDVGSCCGYRPQCLNHDSPTDAAAVKAHCASEGRVGICGFPAIAGCQCVQGHCAATLQTDQDRVQ